jgi:RNA polymerase sigma-70 factor (ECF subfamily)
MPTDEELVGRIRAGDRDAFDALYDRYARRLFSYLARMLKDRSLAEDLFQEVFLEVLREDALDLRDRHFAGWLFTVARNRALTHVRNQERRKGALADMARSEPKTESLSPEEALHQKSQLERLAAVLSTLSEPHHDALLLKEVGGLTYRQIAQIQDVPEGTAKSRLHTAVKAVRSALGVHGDDHEL